MLPVPYFIIIVIILLTLYAGITWKKQKDLRDKNIRSLWAKGYSKGYIANVTGATRKKVTEVISKKLL